MMNSLPAGGDAAAAASSPEDNHVFDFSDEKPKAVQRRMASSEAGKRQRSSVSESISWYCYEFASTEVALFQSNRKVIK